MLLISCTSDKVWNVPLVSACCLCNLQSTTGPFRTTPTSTTGICGSRCTKELSPCRCSSLWRHSGPVCRYHISPCDPHLWLYTITSLFQMSYMWVLKSTYLDLKKKNSYLLLHYSRYWVTWTVLSELSRTITQFGDSLEVCPSSTVFLRAQLWTRERDTHWDLVSPSANQTSRNKMTLGFVHCTF